MFRGRKRNTGWVWPDKFPTPPKDVVRIMDRLTRLSPEDAERVVVRVVQECRESRVAEDMATPSEKRFVDRQYARAMAALTEIAEAGEGDNPAIEKAQAALDTNRRAEEQHQQAAAERGTPEAEELAAELWGPEEPE